MRYIAQRSSKPNVGSQHGDICGPGQHRPAQ